MFLWVCLRYRVHPPNVTSLALTCCQIRYYSIVLLIFDVTQIHLFARPGITSDKVYVPPSFSLNSILMPGTSCLGMDPTIRVIGAVSLWSIEIIMQLRIYALYEGNKKVSIAVYHFHAFALTIKTCIQLNPTGCFV